MMTSRSARLQRALVLPLVVLLVVLLEAVAAFEVSRSVHSLHLRVAILMILYGAGFSIAAGWVTPWLKNLVSATRRTTHRTGGRAGTWLFFAVAYGLLYYAFYLLETRGTAALLPSALT